MNAYLNDIEAKNALISKNVFSLNISDKITIKKGLFFFDLI